MCAPCPTEENSVDCLYGKTILEQPVISHVRWPQPTIVRPTPQKLWPLTDCLQRPDWNHVSGCMICVHCQTFTPSYIDTSPHYCTVHKTQRVGRWNRAPQTGLRVVRVGLQLPLQQQRPGCLHIRHPLMWHAVCYGKSNKMELRSVYSFVA